MGVLDYTRAVDDPASYWGRINLKQRLEMVLADAHLGSRISVWGPRRMGTTSTINLALSLGRSSREVVTYIDLRQLNYPATWESIEQAILSGHYVRFGSVSGGKKESVADLKQPQIVALDEVDILSADELWRTLGFLTMASEFGGSLSLVLGSSQSLPSLEGERYDQSPYSATFMHFRLRPLTAEDAMDLARRLSAETGDFLEQHIDWILEFAGRWPFYLKLMCHHTLVATRVKNTHSLTAHEKREVERQVLAEAMPYLSTFWKQLDDQLKRTILLGELSGRWVRELEWLGVVEDSEGTKKRRDWRLLRQFIRGQSASTLLGSSEAELPADEKPVFVCYSHQDSKWLSRLLVHLRPLERQGIIDVWSDKRISTGEDWLGEIRQALEKARVAILLVSADFLASDFFHEYELPHLLAGRSNGDLSIVPLIVGPSRFKATEGLSRFQAVNDPDRPLSSMENHESESLLVEASEVVERIIREKA